MKKTILAAVAAAFAFGAAPPNPVSWKLENGPAKAVRPGARFTVRLLAQIDEGWHMYSMKPLEDGPIPTRIWIGEGQPFQLAGSVGAPPPETVRDPNFNMEVEFYESRAAFTLPVRVSPQASAGAHKLQVSASYQSCNDKICLPPKTVQVELPIEIR